MNEWFGKDAVLSAQELLSQTFELVSPDKPLEIPVALVSVSNDAIRLDRLGDKVEVPEGKRYAQWPAVKIARLGVHREFQGLQLGTHIIDLLRRMFLCENRTGCRIMTVDAYNNERTLKFYLNNSFEYLSDKDKDKQTRAMWFDLKRLLLEAK